MRKRAKITAKKQSRDYYRLNHYDMMLVENKSDLIYAVKTALMLSTPTSRMLDLLQFNVFVLPLFAH